MNQGWECPGCGRCYAPIKMACDHCPPVVTTGANTTENVNLRCGPCRARGRCDQRECPEVES